MIKAIVTDIEGTTSSLGFVKDVLFPYARQHMAAFIRQNASNPQVAPLITEVKQQVDVVSLNDVIAQLTTWIDQDKKITVLKSLQGLLWEAGYNNGDFKGHIYADAQQYLARWFEQGIILYVYSSGSIHAQKLLFGHTEYGDLTYLFSGYFDTTIGVKLDVASYRHIISTLRLAADEILFLSDSDGELSAAHETGMHTVALLRQDEDGVASTSMLSATSPAWATSVSCFSDIDLQQYQ